MPEDGQGGYPFQPVRLYTASGGFVVAGEVPHFITGPPEIIVWGERFFRYDPAHDTTEEWGYTEAFTVALVRTTEEDQP